MPKEKRDELLRQFLMQQGFICVCGRKLRAGALQVLGLSKSAVMGPQGVGMNLQVRSICSRKCEQYTQMIDDSDIDVLCERPLPTTTWFSSDIKINEPV
jgi:hypothetical protein